jgi:hypothetical protein
MREEKKLHNWLTVLVLVIQVGVGDGGRLPLVVKVTDPLTQREKNTYVKAE